MKKFLSILGGIVLGAAAVAGIVYGVLYILKKRENGDCCCYIDDEDIDFDDGDFEDEDFDADTCGCALDEDESVEEAAE